MIERTELEDLFIFIRLGTNYGTIGGNPKRRSEVMQISIRTGILVTLWVVLFAVFPRSGLCDGKADLNIGFVEVDVPDIGKARVFYRDALGLKEVQVLPSKEKPILAIYSTGSDVTLLLHKMDKGIYDKTAREPVVTHYPSKAGPRLIFIVDEIEERIKQLSKKRVKLIPTPRNVGLPVDAQGVGHVKGFGRFIQFEDPFGNVHELLEPERD